MVASTRHDTHVWLYCGQKGTDPNAISSNLPLTVLCQWNTKTVPWNSIPWNSKVEYDNRGIARVLFHGFGAIPRVLVSSAGVVSEETPATACVFVDVPRRRIARTLSVPSLRTGRPYKLVSYIELHGELRAPVCLAPRQRFGSQNVPQSVCTPVPR